MKKRTKAIVISGALAVSLVALTNGPTTPSTPAPTVKPIVATEDLTEYYIDHAAVLSALTETEELVGLTGTASKTVGYKDSKWYGGRDYEMTVKGTFKIGVDTEDLDVSVNGNTITVRFPQPELLSTDFPFDIADIKKDVGLLRSDLNEAELQALYGEARTGAIEDVKRNRQAFEQAEDSVERSITKIIGMVTEGNVVKVKFEEENE